MTTWAVATTLAVALTVSGLADAQGTGSPPSPRPLVLVDSSGNVAGRPLDDTLLLVTVANGIVAPALIRPIYDADGHTASGLATWRAGGSVLFSSPDCTAGAHVYGSTHTGVRAATQVETPAGITLYAGAVGTASTVAVQSILYDTGCASVTVRQNGLFPVVAIVNLSTAFPPPLSFQ
jgi:hypothetical protein